MADKLKVIVEVAAGEEVTIKPIAAAVAKKLLTSVSAKKKKPKLTGTGTITGVPGGGDVDGDVDF